MSVLISPCGDFSWTSALGACPSYQPHFYCEMEAAENAFFTPEIIISVEQITSSLQKDDPEFQEGPEMSNGTSRPFLSVSVPNTRPLHLLCLCLEKRLPARSHCSSL